MMNIRHLQSRASGSGVVVLAGLLFLSACGSGVTASGDALGQADGADDSGGDGPGPTDGGESDGSVGKDVVDDDTGAEGGSDDTAGGGSDNCPVGGQCDDGDPCTFDDRCAALGACVGTAYSCDDGRACTVDTCTGAGGCSYAVATGSCFVANVCYGEGDSPPGNSCAVCDPGTSQTALIAALPGPCDDGNACTFGDTCFELACVGNALFCDDGFPCTLDTCNAETGCEYDAQEGPCDDGDACTLGDACAADGNCEGSSSLGCNDGDPCTFDFCDAQLGCQTTQANGPCEDGDVCTISDFCEAGECQAGAPNGCNDGNSCTDDACDPAIGCVHTPADNPCCVGGVNPCDDGNPCTNDLCGEGVDDCLYEVFTGSCSDGDPCTQLDACQSGECVGNPVQCDDGNPCTDDTCAGGLCGFAPAAAGTPCDDGLPCSTGDACAAGSCVPADVSGCACAPEFDGPVSKVVALAIGDEGAPGKGVDVDGNPQSCAPKPNCSGGIDNSLSGVAAFANAALGESIAAGDLVLLYEHHGYTAPGMPYGLRVFVGDVADAACNVQGPGCNYTVAPDSFDADCNPVVELEGAVISGDKLNAGGGDAAITLPLPIAGLDLQVSVFKAKLTATVVLQGGTIASMTGVLGGAVKKSDLEAAIAALPDDTFEPPLSKDTVLSFLGLLVQNDIDIDGDGVPEAASIGLPFSTVSGNLIGVTPQ